MARHSCLDLEVRFDVLCGFRIWSNVYAGRLVSELR